MTDDAGALKPKAPRSWARYDREPNAHLAGHPELQAWRRGRVLVLSSLIHAEFHGERRWQWLVSISAGGWRATDDEVKRVLRDFGMERAEEDNHQPGRSRGFFLLVDSRPDDPPQCECKETEEVVIEPDGFRWQRERTRG